MQRLDRGAQAGGAALAFQGNSRAVETIVAAFNTWAYKREQPTTLDGIRSVVADALLHKEPVGFVLYWGKGPRHLPGTPEAQCLDYLANFTSRIARTHAQGARLTLILTDTHARLNGYPEARIDEYFSAVTRLARQMGYYTCLLSSVVSRYDGGASSHVASDPALLQALSASAAKWYQGDLTPDEAALRYFALNMREKKAVGREFGGDIFITFNGSKVRALFPDNMPTFYMYSIRKGVAVKPWFMELPATIAEPQQNGQSILG